jgi:uncharacterized protein (DUF1800 family)
MKQIHRHVLAAAALVLAGAGGAWAAALPQRLDEADARHLLSRTGFTPSPAELRPWVGQTPAQAVDRLLANVQQARLLVEPPAFTREPIEPPLNRLDDPALRKAALERVVEQSLELRTWWLEQMLATPTPLAERMTLFWHNHFSTSVQKVRQPQGMWRQHELLRRQALGSFRELLHGIARDPAMLIYLDGAGNRVQAPNENFAREVMELFTLGEGHYTEADVKEAARAFSGWTVDREQWQARLRPRLHDAGSKTVLGRSGRFGADEVLDLLLEQPQAARFISGKLWREFVSPEPRNAAEKAELERVAERLRTGDWQMAPALRELLLSEAFWAPENRAVLIKSPVELAVGSLRQFEMQLADALPVSLVTARLGQGLFAPPNVKGWPGYTAWIDSTTLLERKRFTERLFRAVEMTPAADGMATGRRGEMREMRDSLAGAPPRERKAALAQLRELQRGGGGKVNPFGFVFDVDGWLRGFGAWPDREPDAAAKARIESVVLAAPAVNAVPAGTVGLAYLRALTLDAAYQLK